MYKKMGTVFRKLMKCDIEDENAQLVKFQGRLTDNAITAHVFIVGVPSETTKMTLMGWYKL